MHTNTIIQPKVEPEYSPEIGFTAMTAAKDFLIKAEGFSFTANFGFINNRGKVEPHIKQACHYAMNNTPSLSNIVLVATENGRDRREEWPSKGYKTHVLSYEESLPFLEWFLYGSFWSPWILNRNDFDFCSKYGFIFSAKTPNKVLQTALVITRHFLEVRPESFRNFNKMVSEGVLPELAYSVNFNTTYSRLNFEEKEGYAPAECARAAHRAFYLLSLKELNHFIKQVPLCENLGTPWIEQPTIYGSSELFIEQRVNREGLIRELFNDQKFCAKLREYRGEEAVLIYRPPNPFDRKAIQRRRLNKNTQITYPELFEVAVPFIMETYYGNGH